MVIETADILLRANRYSGSGNWLDESGNGHNATPFGSPTWDGQKFTLNGSSQYFVIADDPVFDVGLADTFTVVVVFAPVAKVPAALEVVFDNKVIGSLVAGVALYIDTSGNGIHRIADGSSGTQAIVTAANMPGDGVRRTDGYRIEGRAAGGLDAVIGGTQRGTASTATIGAIAPGNDFYIGSITGGSGGNHLTGDIYGLAIWRSALSDADIATAGTELVQLPPPANPAAVAASSSAIDVSWDDVTGETGYRVERSPNGSTGWTDVSGNLAGGSTTYQDTGLSASTQYFYRVVAFNADGDGESSTVVNATTDAAASGDSPLLLLGVG